MKEPFHMPEEDRIRLNRAERDYMELLIHAELIVKSGLVDLSERLSVVPEGKARMADVHNRLDCLFKDIAGTIPEKQRRGLLNYTKDTRMQIVPKLTPSETYVTIYKQDAEELVDAAMEKCLSCTELNDECRDCKVRNILEVVVPLNRYDGLLCPYSRAEWEE